MNANRHHANRPDRLTPADHLRQARAIAAYDARQAAKRRTARLLRLAYVCGCIALAVKLFYSAT